MAFTGFPKEGLEFLSNIIINNSKEWLDAHKDEYEKYIVTPNKAYVEDMGEYLQILVPNIHAIPKVNKSLFRIYRDARFHRLDPIKERIGIIFWQGSTHRMQSASFYMHYDPFEVFVATGIRNFKAPLLTAYREYIKNDVERESLHHILEALKAKGYSVPAPQFKRYPSGLNKEDKYAYLYLFSAMYAFKIFHPNHIFHAEKIIEQNFKVYKDMLDLHQWVYTLTCMSEVA
ncbi:MAG: TIGR02453 family protein [Sulfurovum sp.]|nr:MAG: TIGR02453 family protein [Sulfurovum sp.]